MATDFLSRVADEQRRLTRERFERYLEVARSIADGSEPDATTTATVLSEAGKTVEQLGRDVELIRQRRQWRADMDAKPRLVAQIDAARAKIAKADASLKAAEDKHREATYPLFGELESLQAAMARAADAAPRLLRETPNTLLRDEWMDLSKQISDMGAEVARAKVEADQHRQAAEGSRREMENRGDRRGLWLADVQQRQCLAKQAEGAVAEIESKMAPLRARVAELEQQLLEP